MRPRERRCEESYSLADFPLLIEAKSASDYFRVAEPSVQNTPRSERFHTKPVNPACNPDQRSRVTHAWARSISRIVCKRTLAPLAQSCQRVNSLGEWLMPSTLGTKIIPIGAIFAIIWAS